LYWVSSDPTLYSLIHLEHICYYVDMPGKPRTSQTKSRQEDIEGLKARFLEYYEDLPIKQAACDHIGRDLTTVQRWEKADKEFGLAVQMAKAAFARLLAAQALP
jgi:hypothetical protein